MIIYTMAGLFFYRGYNYKTKKYDIGYLDNKECIKLKEMLNVSHITIKNHCPKYIDKPILDDKYRLFITIIDHINVIKLINENDYNLIIPYKNISI